ncbi:hypothetical protein ACSQ67_019081 [Phaseolus vulgaris]
MPPLMNKETRKGYCLLVRVEERAFELLASSVDKIVALQLIQEWDDNGPSTSFDLGRDTLESRSTAMNATRVHSLCDKAPPRCASEPTPTYRLSYPHKATDLLHV